MVDPAMENGGYVLSVTSQLYIYRHVNTPYRNPERAALKPLINTNYLCADTATKITVMLKDSYFYGFGPLHLCFSWI